MIDAVTVGETMALVRTLKSGPPQNNDACTLAIGGAESNVAIGLARLGHKVRWVSALGQDAFGDMIQATLQDEGVEVIADRSGERPTGLMVKSPSTGNERFVSYYRAGSAASAMNPESVPDSLLQDARLLHLTGITPALSESARRLCLELAAKSKQLGLAFSFDINFRPALWSRPQASLIAREIAQHADLLFGDRAELELLIDEPAADDELLLEQVAQSGIAEVVMKRGSAGALAFIRGEHFDRPAIEVPIVDTVGAGDAFVAGYLSGFLDATEIEERLLRAVICGARACQSLGDWEGTPLRAELQEAKLELAS